MRRTAQALLLVLTGLGLLHATLFTDLYLRYVKEGLRLPLIASGVLLLLAGLGPVAKVPAARRRPARTLAAPGTDPSTTSTRACTRHAEGGDHGHTHGHDHTAAPRIAWLLFLPALSLLLFAPPALGAYTASRAGDRPVQAGKRFDPLPDTPSPLPMTLTDFTARVRQDRQRDIRGRSVRMTGFVTPAGQGGGWYLTRIIFTCCAADSQSVKVRMYGPSALPANTWVAVTGTWHPHGTLGTGSASAALDVHRVQPVPQPVNAYTDDLPLTPS
ncbi:TIGR03943 family protein [Streptomyces sp. NPDC020298]|uniref:TIGR03943 family putative permease subunit n=1 Tax=unclassified Streptomyces TaxID=2593676 RepID=UPI0033D94AAF